MPVTQIAEFGFTSGKTLTAQLFAQGSDTVVATASSVTEATNRKGRYAASFTDVAAADYLLVYFLGGSGAGSEYYTLTLDTATFTPWSEIKAATPAQVAASITVVPLTGVVQARTDGTTISVFVAETVTVSIAVVDSEGTAVDVSAMTLTLLVERTDGTDVSTVANADITKSSSTISFAIPSAVSANEGNYRWTLRQATGNAVLMSGPLIVAHAAQAD